jgi:hypothetical protein
VKRSGRDEPIWVAIHKCMETIQEIFLYSYLYLKLAKTACFPYYLLYFFFTKAENKMAEQILSGGQGMGEMAQIIYTHVSKCKNDKIK